jgi:hypothetical protein
MTPLSIAIPIVLFLAGYSSWLVALNWRALRASTVARRPRTTSLSPSEV